jgi:hypothetical protein
MQIEYEGFRKRTEYHCSIFTESIPGIVIYILPQGNNGVKIYLISKEYLSVNTPA